MRIKQAGFSIIEIFVSLVVGLFLLAGVMATFVSMRTTTTETTTFGELQENGRFAISVITDDLLRQNFWGGLSGNLTFSGLTNVPAVLASDCAGEGINNNTFPQPVGHFRAIWGDTLTSANALGCITDAKTNSDIIQIKRVISSASTAAQVDDERYYLITNMNAGEIFAGDAAIPTMDYGTIWEYQHHIYYIKEYTQGNITVPALMLGRLRNQKSPPIFFDPIVDGIERIHFDYGVDTTGDGVVNAFIPAEDMPAAYWDNENDAKILAVTVYVLVRSILPDDDYENKNTYQMGKHSVNFLSDDGSGDNYRRLLFTSTISLYNARIESW